MATNFLELATTTGKKKLILCPAVYELDRKHMLIDINELSFSNGIFMSRGDGFYHLPTLHPSQRLWNVFKIN